MPEELPLGSELTTKTAAMEIVLIALLREQRDNTRLWDNIEKVTALALSDPELQKTDPRLGDSLQDWLDLWRDIAGKDPGQPAQA